MFRDIAQPEHLYRMRMEVVEPGPEPIFGDPGFCEAVEVSSGPARIVDIRV